MGKRRDNGLSKAEKITLWLAESAMKRGNQHISVWAKGKTVDVTVHPWNPERTAKWSRISPAKIYECSECGQNVMTDDIGAYQYCHGCGARMDALDDARRVIEVKNEVEHDDCDCDPDRGRRVFSRGPADGDA